MSIAALTHPSLLTPLQSLFRWFASGTTPVRPVARAPAKVNVDATKFVANFSEPTRTTKANCLSSSPDGTSRRVRPTVNSLTRTVRVSRLVEEGQAAANVGRMVISGRMEDVCAELDRLAGLSRPPIRELTLH